jgi:hypothetical protein
VREVELLEAALAVGVDLPNAGVVPLLKAVGRPLWRKLPEGVRDRLRKSLPR